jgi:hypothetical protein
MLFYVDSYRQPFKYINSSALWWPLLYWLAFLCIARLYNCCRAVTKSFDGWMAQQQPRIRTSNDQSTSIYPGCCWWRRQLLVSFRILLRGPFTFLLALNTPRDVRTNQIYTAVKNNKASTSRLFSTSHYYYYMRTNSLSTRRWTIGHDLVVHGICENTHRIDCMVYFFG